MNFSNPQKIRMKKRRNKKYTDTEYAEIVLLIVNIKIEMFTMIYLLFLK